MDAENFANDSANSPQPERTTEMDSRDSGTLRDEAAELEPEHSEFDDLGFRAVWVIPAGLGIFLAAVALLMSIT